MPQVSYSRLALLALIVLGVFFAELGAARLWDRDEPRNARASHEMLARGDWIVPTFNGSLRDHKPILLYWGQMLSYLALGESEFAARLPSALSAVIAVLCIGLLASRLAGKTHGLSQEGFWAAGSLATCLLFVMAGRAATPDSCLIAFSTLGIAALVISVVRPVAPYSSGAVGKARWIPAMFGYTMLGLAGLAKGPVGIVLPLVVVHTWWMICHRWQNHSSYRAAEGSLLHRIGNMSLEAWRTFNPRECLRALWALKTIPGLLLCMLAAVPWYLAVGLETNGAFLRGFFLEHNLGRAMGSMEGHQGSLLYYPVAFVVGTFPWSLWLIPILMWCRSASRESVIHRQMVVLSAVWISVYLVAFSAAGTKLPSYITPCYAGGALAIGGYWRQFENAWARPTRRMRGSASVLTIAVGLAIFAGLLWLSRHEAMPRLATVAIAGVIVAVMGLLSLVWESQSKTQWIPLTWLVGAATFQLLLFGFGAKSVDSYRRDLAALSELKQTSDGQPWLAIGGLEPSWVHYLDTNIVEVTLDAKQPEAWQQVDDFVTRFRDGHIIVVGEEAYKAMDGWQQKIRLQEIASAPRFLRPGMMRVFRPARPSPSAEPPTENHNLFAGQPQRNDEDAGRALPTANPALPAENPALPADKSAGQVHSDPQNNVRTEIPRTAKVGEYNPLRPHR